MSITIHSTFLPHTDAETSLAFYRDVLLHCARPQLALDEDEVLAGWQA